ncbi:MAG: hypothetical protein RI988_1438 [Pseudomonadota bacterium]|jgi:glycosyltransferase involved in cell wall biosynthesis
MNRVALVVIARDEAPRIARLLHSVSPWVDEMVVLDTGSRDDTARLAREAGARVHTFQWVNDFAAARNAALAHAACDWHLVLDADEWLVEGGPFLRELQTLAPAFVGALRLENHTGPEGAVRSVEWLTRLLPGDVRYSGTVHEQPEHALPRLLTPLRVEHDGYLPAALAAKHGRNRRLLQEAVELAPDDAYLWYQLGKDASVYDEHASAEEAFAQARSRMRGDEPWHIDLVVRRVHGLTRLGEHERALRFARAELEACNGSPDFHFACGNLFLDWTARAPEQAQALLDAAEGCWRTCLEIGEKPDIPGAVLGRGGALAAFNLALVCEGTGREAEAARLRARHGLGGTPSLNAGSTRRPDSLVR